MKKCSSVVAMFILFLMVVLAVPLAAQEKAKAEAAKDMPKMPVPRVSEASFSRELILNGRAVNDPYLLLQAAQLIITSGKIPSPKGAREGTASEGGVEMDAAKLLKEAAQMAGDSGDRQAIQMAGEIARNKVTGLGNDALADEISKTRVARDYAAGGTLRGSNCIAPGEIIYWNVVFRGGEDAAASVSSSNPYAVLTLSVHDGYGLVAADATNAYKSNAYIRWHTSIGGTLRVALSARYAATCYSITVH